MYYVFKSIPVYSINTKTLVVSDLVLARRGSENVFDRPLVLENIINTTDDFSWVLKIIMIYYFIMIFVKLNLLVFPIMKYSMIYFYSLCDSFPHWAYDVLMLSFVLFLTGLAHASLFEVVVWSLFLDEHWDLFSRLWISHIYWTTIMLIYVFCLFPYYWSILFSYVF